MPTNRHFEPRTVLVLVIFTFVVFTSGCTREAEIGSPDIMTSIPAVALIVQPIAGDLLVGTVLKEGVSPHAYQPRPSDMTSMMNAGILVSAHPDVDGWFSELSGGSGHILFESDTFSGEGGAHADVHFWSDPQSVLKAIPGLVAQLCSFDPGGCPAFRRRATAFSVRINSVTARISEILSQNDVGSCVVTAQPFVDRFLDRFEVERIGPVSPSPEHEPSPASLASVIEEARERDCNHIILQNTVSNDFMLQLAKESGWQTIEVDPLGSDAVSYEGYLLSITHSLTSTGS